MSSTYRYQIPVEQTQWKFEGQSETILTWEYEDGRSKLLALYDKGKKQQWDAATRIDWSQDLDPENPMMLDDRAVQIWGSPVWERLTDKERVRVRHHLQAQTLSQFMHGEQGALICTAKIVEQVPWIDAKYYAATQVMDEARHVEVYSKYLSEKLAHEFQVNVHLRALLDDVVSDSRWDMTYLGMQIMVEGLALAAFGFQYQTSPDPLLKQITRYVMADEARHVAFGVMSLKEAYQDLDAADIRERQEFCYEAAVKMRDRFLGQEVWEWAGLPVKECTRVMLDAPMQREFRKMLFSKIVPNAKKLGLLDAGDGWLREKFTELGVIQFEDWVDTGEEYAMLDEV
ncbi:MAG TPA: ferritin-like domain-containing protein, partial [Candidatus Dormibacteraeota bacterium]|nr:ferritin-like domain-containing protein [Candidatus Dormibacteraeota bacterium]